MADTPASIDIDDLDSYYTNCVIGGPGAFMIPVNDWSQFPEAIRRKLVLELAASMPPIGGGGRPPVVRRGRPATTARSAREIWRNRSWMLDSGEVFAFSA